MRIGLGDQLRKKKSKQNGKPSAIGRAGLTERLPVAVSNCAAEDLEVL
jgi:hypothetical protein